LQEPFLLSLVTSSSMLTVASEQPVRYLLGNVAQLRNLTELKPKRPARQCGLGPASRI
jgi:hypothetical protein